MNGININNLHPAILNLMLQRNETQQQQHSIETSLEANRKTLEKCRNADQEARAEQISERMKNQEIFLETKRKQLTFVNTCIEFLEFAQEQQVLFGRNKMRVKIDEELLRTATFRSGPQILENIIGPEIGQIQSGNCLRILTVDLGTDSNQLDWPWFLSRS